MDRPFVLSAEFTPENAARVLAGLEFVGRAKRAAAETGHLKVAEGSLDAVTSAIKDWWSSHPELHAPLAGAAIGGVAGTGLGLARKKNPLSAGLLGALAGGAGGAAYGALGGLGENAAVKDRAQKLEAKAINNGSAASYVANETLPGRAAAAVGSGVKQVGEFVDNALGKPANPYVQERMLGGVPGAMAENPLTTAGALTGGTLMANRTNNINTVANFKHNAMNPDSLERFMPGKTTTVPGSTVTDKWLPDGTQTRTMKPGPDITQTAPHPHAADAQALARNLHDPNFLPFLDRHSASAGVPGLPPLPGPMTAPSPLANPRFRLTDPSTWRQIPSHTPLLQSGRQANAVRNFAQAHDAHGLLESPMDKGEPMPIPGRIGRAGAGLRTLGGAFAGGMLGNMFDRAVVHPTQNAVRSWLGDSGTP